MRFVFTLIALSISTLAFCQGLFQKETVNSLTFVSGHVIDLAKAIPAEKYSYAPQQGVRSVADVCGHIISANYFFASKLGAKIPADVNMMTIEKDIKTKEVAEKELKRSYDILIESIKNTKDASLSAKVEFPFPGEYTSMSAIIIALGHSNEHLGQLIAYGRVNGIKPPWSE